MSRHGRTRYFDSNPPQCQEKRSDEQHLKVGGVQQDKAGNKQSEENTVIQCNASDDNQLVEDEEKQKDTAKDKHKDRYASQIVDSQESGVIRRKRFYSEADNDTSIEEPKSPSKEVLPNKTCCTENCTKDLDIDKIGQELKEEFVTGSKLLSRNKLLAHLIGQGNVGLRTDCFNWKGSFFCVKTFSELAGQSEYSIKKVLSGHTLGKTEFVHGNSGHQKFSEKTMCFKVWMRAFLERNSQSAPDSQVQVLAHWVTKSALYEMYKKDTVEPHLAPSTFRQYIKSHFGHNRLDQSEPQVRFSKHSSHSVCEQCCAFNAARITCKNKDDLKKINSLKARHFDLVGGARLKMEEIKQVAIQYPEDSVVIQIDGMDNSKSYCPRMKEKSKKYAGLLRLPTKIQGCIIYSGNYVDKRKILFYLNHDQFPQSSNMVVSTIQKLLEDIVKDHGRLPKNLHVFADNCYRENKNRY